MKNAWRDCQNAWRDSRSVARALAHHIFEDRLTQAAGSLTFTTLLSIVPLLTVALALSTAFPVFDRLMEGLQDWVIDNFLPEAGLDEVVEQLNGFTEGIGRLTTIGLGVLGVLSIMLMLTIDDVINRIFRVERKRPFAQRVMMYWAVLTLGPLLIGAGISMTSALVVNSLGALSLDGLAQAVLRVLPFLLTWAALASLYLLVPNRPIALRHALWGGFIAGLAFELAKRGFAVYVSNFPTYTLVYGTFATLLIFLVWLYVSWLVVLAGATLTAMLTEKSKILERAKSRS
jgi:membrane protein